MSDNTSFPPKNQFSESVDPAEDEKAWLQSGIYALKDAEQNGYACTAEELDQKITKLKKSDWASHNNND
ncbi:hypothetical protein [Leucothrix pacifica]|uniref:Uncharacterized protein n=1 Tax=Leucothrix pacifica TaxID=1247513 RepID=A0A317CKQ1_9GAMM|nr:hypothetical protein [Leucothrix pacifica]PWQ98023.1 hypothetical protein DKW60_08770 [Leucothrix pacifica]